MRIVLDAMGSDSHPEPELQASVEASRLFGEEIILVGPTDLLEPRLQALGGDKVRIIHAAEVIEMTDKPAENARKKAQNSMAIGMDLLKSGDGDAFITAGNTGGAMATALFHLGRIQGVKRPALTALFPVKGGHCVVLDIGANTECKPEYLLQFALMGSLYAQKVLNQQSPRIGLLSNGEEAGKGNILVKETYPLLEQSGLNFIGNIEGKELFGGLVDVAVMDGFTGNILLKSSEAVAKLLVDLLKEEIYRNFRTKIGGALAKPAFDSLKKIMDPGEVGAAPLLGIDGMVFVGHGRSNAHALVSAIKVARQAIEANLLESIQFAIQESVKKSDIKESK
jgi:glycerol-3-phosphate acyltransferase PlsX